MRAVAQCGISGDSTPGPQLDQLIIGDLRERPGVMCDKTGAYGPANHERGTAAEQYGDK
jgi:hypothetical protein